MLEINTEKEVEKGQEIVVDHREKEKGRGIKIAREKEDVREAEKEIVKEIDRSLKMTKKIEKETVLEA